MKRFKVIDFWVNVVLILGFIVYGICKQNESFLAGYFVVGGWQIISMGVHFFNKWFYYKGTKRYRYHIVVMVIIFLAIIVFCFYRLIFIYQLMFFVQLLFCLLIALLFAAPVMAIYYTWICYEETYIKMQRPLALLK